MWSPKWRNIMNNDSKFTPKLLHKNSHFHPNFKSITSQFKTIFQHNLKQLNMHTSSYLFHDSKLQETRHPWFYTSQPNHLSSFPNKDSTCIHIIPHKQDTTFIRVFKHTNIHIQPIIIQSNKSSCNLLATSITYSLRV